MKVHLVKDQFGALRAADEESVEVIKKWPQGEYLTADVTRPRNSKFHRLFFALLTTVHHHLPEEMEPRFPTVKQLLYEVKMQVGHFDTYTSLGGKEYYVPRSIAFAEMDQDKFDQFFGRAISVCRRHFLPGVSEPDLRREIDAELSRYG